MNFQSRIKDLQQKIQDSYESGVTLDQAEKLAAEFLHAQIQISEELRNTELDARMKKSGIKAVRATAYLEIVSGSDKKPTEAGISAIIDSDDIVKIQQGLLDTAEVNKADLERYYDIFQNAHIYFRGISKGRFE